MPVTRRLTGFDGRAVRVSHALSAGAALAVLAAVRADPRALAVAAAGALLLAVALVRRAEGGVVLAGVLLFGGTVLVAAGDGTALSVLVGAFGAVLSADFGTFALGLDRDVDPSVATARVELLHAVGSVAVAVLTGGVGYALFRSVPQGSGVGVVALLFAAVVLAVALGD